MVGEHDAGAGSGSHRHDAGTDRTADAPEGSKSTPRRRYLGALTATIAGLAGCSSISDGSDSGDDSETNGEAAGTASLATLDVSLASERVGQTRPVTVDVTVGNGDAKAFEGSTYLEGADGPTPGTPISLAPGERTTVTFEPEYVMVGERTVTATVNGQHADAEPGVTVDRSASAQLHVEQFPEDFLETDGTTLTCGDGVAYVAGSTPAELNDPPLEPGEIEDIFALFERLGLTGARVWGYASRWSNMRSIPEPYSYNEAFFEYFDRVIVEAKRRGIRLFVPMFNGNPAYGEVTEDDLGTNVPQFVRWADDAETYNDFFTSEECREMYTDWVETLLTHENHLTGVEYRNEPTIALWELGNEIQHADDRIGETIRPWIEDVGAFVQELDGTHPLSVGSYGHQGRNAFVEDNLADPIDVVSIHYYPGPLHYDLPEDEVVPLLEETIQTAHEEIGKPLYVGEYDWGIDTETDPPYEDRVAWFDRLHEVFASHDVAATNQWTIQARPRSDAEPWELNAVFAPSDEESTAAIERYAARLGEKSTTSCSPFGEET